MESKGYTYEYPHAALTADCVIFGFDGVSLKILLIERGAEPFKGMWALPGGFMRMDETIEQTARRELHEETGLRHVYMDQFRVFSGVRRDPRERVVTVAFIALVRPSDYEVMAGDDASNALWFDEDALPPMAFDHDEIIRRAREHLSEVLRIKPVAFELLNKVFTLPELQKVYEVINRTCYDRRNFQRKALQCGMLEEVETGNDCSGVNAVRYGSLMAGVSAGGSPCLEERRAAPSPGRASQPKGRPASKLFSFNFIRKDKKEDRKEESSTRDIFDF